MHTPKMTLRTWLEEWKIDSPPDLPGIFALADSPKLEKIFYIGACPRSLRDEAELAECDLGLVIRAVEMFYPTFVFLYWPCPSELGLIGQLPDLSQKLIGNVRPLLNVKSHSKQIESKTTSKNGSIDAELLV